MTTSKIRIGVRSFAATAVLALAGAGQAVAAEVAVPLKASGYKYQQVAWGAGAGFEAIGFDDSAWSTGGAGFGTFGGTCTWNNATVVSTPWAVNTDLLVRKAFALPTGATNLRVRGTVDNDATVYINGQQIGFTASGSCIGDTIDFTAPDSLLVAGQNVLAVRGHDTGFETFLDQEVTYELPAFSLCLLYDPSKSHKSGSTVPLKFQLCDANGNNLSSPSVIVHAAGLSKVDGSASNDVEDSGQANPDDDFRYDASLGGTGGYIFNKSTKGLSAGTWSLVFTVDGASHAGYRLRFDVR